MAILQALVAAVMRSAGRLLNTAFGWATVMIFGKVPEDRQIYLSVIAFGSVLWILVVLGIAFPVIGTFLLSFVPLPARVGKGLVRLAMLAAAVLVPPLIGVVSLFLKDPDERPQGAGPRVRAVLKGYPFTLGLAVTLVMMTAFAPLLKLRALARRWTGQHVPMLVEAEDYGTVVGDVQAALRDGGWQTRQEPASWMLRAPTKILTLLAGGSVENLVAERLTTLRADDLEATLHPADLVLQGKEAGVVHARALLAERLAFSRAHLTWTKDGNDLEDRLRGVRRQLSGDGAGARDAAGRLRAIEAQLRRTEVPYGEWEVLCRTLLLVRVAAQQGRLPATGEGWIRRTLLPLGIGVARQALESPRVRSRLEDVVVGWLGRLRSGGGPSRARPGAPPADGPGAGPAPARAESRRAA